MKSHRLFQAPPHAVSFDRVAMFFGDGEADAGFCFWFFPVEHFKQKETTAALFAIADSKKLRAAFQPPGSLFFITGRQFARHLLIGQSGLRPKDACDRVRGEQR
ncbi:hypothetical protein ASE04_03640 [Rhizobium sp. Root708]|nr:hypothetical protein ASE04_03640 [Rhizobium sp. Root708]